MAASLKMHERRQPAPLMPLRPQPGPAMRGSLPAFTSSARRLGEWDDDHRRCSAGRSRPGRSRPGGAIVLDPGGGAIGSGGAEFMSARGSAGNLWLGSRGSSGARFRPDSEYLSAGLGRLSMSVNNQAMQIDSTCRNLPEFATPRLEMHRLVFDRLSGSFRGQSDEIWAKIKAVYDGALDARQKALARAQNEEGRMQVLTDHGISQEVALIHERHTIELRAVYDQLRELREHIAGKSTRNPHNTTSGDVD